MVKCKNGFKKRKFCVLLKNRNIEVKQAIELVGKYGKKYAFVKGRAIVSGGRGGVSKKLRKLKIIFCQKNLN